MAGHPKATKCRFCLKQGLLIKGAHPECKNADDARRYRDKKGPLRCRICGVVVGKRRKYCDKDLEERRNMGKKEPPRCQVCGVLIGKGRRYCDKDRDEVRKQKIKEFRAKAAKRDKANVVSLSTIKPTQVKPVRNSYRKPKTTPAKRVVFKEAAPAVVKPLEGVIITPPDIVVQRVEPVRWMSSLRDLFGVHGEAHTAMD